MGGETGYGSAGLRLAVGLSPRGRGNRKCRYERQDDDGSIPAWAGKPGTPIRRRENGRVYPRVGGETRTIWPFSAYIAGLSPRGRGNLSVLMRMVVVSRSIPAWAGKPRCSIRIGCRLKVYPRVGGETAMAHIDEGVFGGLSPRGRGNREVVVARRRRDRSIPAWAGKPRHGPTWTIASRVYPRVGGETTNRMRSGDCGAGLSPRGRGNLGLVDQQQAAVWSIPAWAGKPDIARRSALPA